MDTIKGKNTDGERNKLVLPLKTEQKGAITMKKTMTMMKAAAALTSIAMSACMFTAVSARQYRNSDDEDYRIVDAYKEDGQQGL